MRPPLIASTQHFPLGRMAARLFRHAAPATVLLARFAVSLVLIGCAKPVATGTLTAAAAHPPAADTVVNVYNWSDGIDPTVVAEFTRTTGIRVQYDVFDSNEVLETKLLAGRTGYDVVVPSAAFLQRQILAGAYRPLDKSLLMNWPNLDPQVLETTSQHDPGNAHAVPYMWGTSGIGYNEKAVLSRMHNAPVNTSAILFDPGIVSRFADCGVAVLDAPTEVVGSVLLYLGKNPNSESADDLEGAERVLLNIRPYIRYINSSRYIEDLAAGDLCLALGWSGDVFQARERAKAAKTGAEIRYGIPKEGAVMFFDMLAIPMDAPHPNAAHQFINFLMRADIAARNSNFIHYPSGNKKSLRLVSADLKNDPALFPPAGAREKLVPDLARTDEFSRRLTRLWTRFRTGASH